MGITGITFATTNKYFKARKAALQMKMAQHATQKFDKEEHRKPVNHHQINQNQYHKKSKRFVPTTIRTKEINTGNNKPLPKQ